MKTFVIIRKSDLKVLNTYQATEADSTSRNRSYLEAEPLAAHLELPSGAKVEFIRGEYKVDCQISQDGDDITLSTDSTSEASFNADKNDELMEKLRIERDLRLKECDWTQLSDVNLPAQLATDYETYRQALRDLPANTSDPANPNWPVKPS